jgi:UDP-GlcNAc3NAcA epimerase
MKVVTVVGARPQFVKAAIVSLRLAEVGGVDERLIHTGQHYDARMSDVFFEELGIPQPAYHLGVGSGGHGAQTGQMLAKIEDVLLGERPDAVLVYGDTNSTIAGALAAAKLHVPVVHVEAGLRSFDRRMPEEINRVLTDRLSALLLCPTAESVENLAQEGIRDGVHLVGDVMYDGAMHFAAIAQRRANPCEQHRLEPQGYILLTCHRAQNTDDPARLAAIVTAAARLAKQRPVLFPVHPRTRKQLDALGIQTGPAMRLVEPASYFEMLLLERSAALVVTDSGGVQKEAFFFGVPCVTVRDTTEWRETLDCGANLLTAADADAIVAACRRQLDRTEPLPDAGPYYGDGQAAHRTSELIAGMVR